MEKAIFWRVVDGSGMAGRSDITDVAGDVAGMAVSAENEVRTASLAMAAVHECGFSVAGDHGMATQAGARCDLRNFSGGHGRGMASSAAALVGYSRGHLRDAGLHSTRNRVRRHR